MLQERQKTRQTSQTESTVSELEKLRLSPEEMQALRRQGFVATETRANVVFFKLRFRLNGRQRTRYLGTDPTRGQAIATELLKVQRQKRIHRQIARLDVAAGRTIREWKTRLVPLLEKEGLYFHGLAVRGKRRSRSM